MSADISMGMERRDLIDELRNPDFCGPMIHLRSWSELQVLMHRAADLLEGTEIDAIVKEALSPDTGSAGGGVE